MSATPPSPASDPIRVAFLEDYPPMRDSLTRLIEGQAHLQLVGGWGKLNGLLDGLASAPADVVLMDIQLGESMDGITATAEVRRRFPRTMVLVLTLFDDPKVVFDALSAGAVGYLLKSAPSAAIVSAIEEVAAGGAPMTGAIARMVIERFHRSVFPGVDLVPGKASSEILSLREAEVLGALASGYRYKEVAARLGLSHNTIRSHVRRIYERLHAHGVIEAANKARQAGVALPGRIPPVSTP